MYSRQICEGFPCSQNTTVAFCTPKSMSLNVKKKVCWASEIWYEAHTRKFLGVLVTS